MTQRWTDFNDAPAQGWESKPETIPTDEVRSALLDRLDQVLAHLLPAGRTKRGVFEVGDIHGAKGDSLKVELNSGKAGMWHDFATGEGGDIFELWAACNGLNTKSQFPEVVSSAQDWLGIARTAPQTARTAAKLPTAPEDELGPHTAKWDYCDANGRLLACVYRYDPQGKSMGGKEFRPWDVLARKHKAPEPRPLYNLPGLKSASHVVLVEGEKAADALLAQGFAATTAMFGSKAPA